MALVTWHVVTRAVYDAGVTAGSIKEDALYFISDTKELYKGSSLFTEAFRFYTGAKPTAPALGVIYINSADLAGDVWTGTEWKAVIKPAVAAVDAQDTVNPVSGKAVADYVAEQIGSSANVVSDVTYKSADVALTVTKGDGTSTNITLDGLGVALNYDAVTGALTMVDKSGNTLGTAVNLDLERFVSAASYNAETKKITLSFNDESTPLEIDVADLVDTYTVGNTGTVNMTMGSNNEITAVVNVSAEANNALTTKADGLHVDISGKMDLVATGKTDEIIVADAAGQGVASGKKAGAATLAATPDANTLATEAAVEAIRVALDARVSQNASDIADNTTLIGTTETNLRNDLVAKTSIVASADLSADAASDNKVASEKALVDAITWKTTV